MYVCSDYFLQPFSGFISPSGSDLDKLEQNQETDLYLIRKQQAALLPKTRVGLTNPH